jgi:hypothetical protein
MIRDQILDIQQSADLIADHFAIAVIYSAGLVDVNPQHQIVAVADRLPVNQLDALSHCNSFDDLSDRFSINLDHCPKKKSGPSPLSQQAGHNTLSPLKKASTAPLQTKRVPT